MFLSLLIANHLVLQAALRDEIARPTDPGLRAQEVIKCIHLHSIGTEQAVYRQQAVHRTTNKRYISIHRLFIVYSLTDRGYDAEAKSGRGHDQGEPPPV